MQLRLFNDIVEDSINILKENEPENEPYYGAFSGGKDSIVIKRIADMAGVKVDWHCHLTTVDPPELLKFIREHHPDVTFDKPSTTMFRLIVKKRMPPTRMVRYCCEYFKEHGGDDRFVMTGVRRAEGNKRSKRKSVECFSKGAIRKAVINPIIRWTNNDVWGFIRSEGLPYCSLYDEGFKRLGCVGCSIAGKAGMEREFKRWPHFKALYIKAFKKMLDNRLKDDILTKWTSGEAVFDWWVNNTKNNDDDKQLKLFE